MFKKFISMAFIIIILLSFIVIPFIRFSSETGNLSIYSDSPHDLSKLRQSVEDETGGIYQVKTIISNLMVLNNIGDEESKIFFKTGFARHATDKEVEAFTEFIRNGGKAVIADDSGLANSLSAPFNVAFYGKTLWDEGNIDPELKDIDFPVANVIDPEISSKHYRVIYNRPTGLVIDNTSEGIFISSITSDRTFIDLTDSGSISEIGDRSMPTPTMARVSFGAGEVFFISDPSMFTNHMIVLNDNREFTLDLINYLLPGGGEIIFDESGKMNDRLLYGVYSAINIVGSIAAIDASSFYSLILPFFFISLVLAVALFVKSRDIWIHKFDLTSIRFLKKIQSKDYVQRMYNCARNKVAIKAMLSVEEASSLSKEELTAEIDDECLKNFLLNPERPYKQSELSEILSAIRKMKK